MITYPVIVGRFQSHTPTIGHKHLINSALRYNPNNVGLIIVGSTDNEFELRNPLPATIRTSILKKLFPSCNVTGIADIKHDNHAWSIRLDSTVESYLPEGHAPLLFGSRDCFKKYYSGKYSIQEIDEIPGISATETRNAIKEDSSEEFASGIIFTINELHKPKWEHDCNHCKFLKRFDEYDLYFCPNAWPTATVIARYGHLGKEYKSGLNSKDPILVIAQNIAVLKGFLK